MFHKLHEYTAEGRRSKGCSKWLEYFSVVLCYGKGGWGAAHTHSHHPVVPIVATFSYQLDMTNSLRDSKFDRIGLQLGWQILNG